MNEKNNNKDIMSLLGSKYILEAEPARTAHKKSRRFKFSVAAAAVAACVGLTAVTAGAFIYRNTRSSTEEFFESRAEEILDSKGLIRHEMNSNEHFDIKLDTVLADDLSYRVMFTAVPKDEAAMSYVDSIRVKPYGDKDIHIEAESSRGERYVYDSSFYYVPEGTDNIVIALEGSINKRYRDIIGDGNVYFGFGMYGDLASDLFDDIGFNVKIEKNLESHMVTLKNGVKLYISPMQSAYIGEDPELVSRSGGGLSFIWKEGGRERFLESLGITPEEDAANLAKDKWVEQEYLRNGKNYNTGKPGGAGGGGFGGHGVGIYLDGDSWINDDGDWVGEGQYAMTSTFSCVLDFDDIVGVNCGFESYMFDD